MKTLLLLTLAIFANIGYVRANCDMSSGVSGTCGTAGDNNNGTPLQYTCTNDQCTIDCTEDAQCDSPSGNTRYVVTCPTGKDCKVTCNGHQGGTVCKYIQLDCTSGYKCEFLTGTDATKLGGDFMGWQGVINCNGSDCIVNCNNHGNNDDPTVDSTEPDKPNRTCNSLKINAGAATSLDFQCPCIGSQSYCCENAHILGCPIGITQCPLTTSISANDQCDGTVVSALQSGNHHFFQNIQCSSSGGCEASGTSTGDATGCNYDYVPPPACDMEGCSRGSDGKWDDAADTPPGPCQTKWESGDCGPSDGSCPPS